MAGKGAAEARWIASGLVRLQALAGSCSICRTEVCCPHPADGMMIPTDQKGWGLTIPGMYNKVPAIQSAVPSF